MTVQTANKALFIADLKRDLNLFLGAGFSVLAKNYRGDKIPLGSELRKKLIEEFELDDFSDLGLPQLMR